MKVCSSLLSLITKLVLKEIVATTFLTAQTSSPAAIVKRNLPFNDQITQKDSDGTEITSATEVQDSIEKTFETKTPAKEKVNASPAKKCKTTLHIN